MNLYDRFIAKAPNKALGWFALVLLVLLVISALANFTIVFLNFNWFNLGVGLSNVIVSALVWQTAKTY